MENNKNELKQRAIAAIEARRAELVQIGHALFDMPETGFREHRTAAYVKERLEGLGLEVRDQIAITGLKAKALGRNHSRCVGVMGELDALVMPSHCRADPATGYGHACGHHAQLVMVLGTAMGLIESGVMQEPAGDVAFLAVPAEETVELEFRKELVKEGKLHFMGGKQEFMLVGAGTVLNVEQAKAVVDAGAQFIVSPGFDSELVKWCMENEVTITPGCVTPTEIMAALKLGVDVVKFFPANVYGGLAAMKNLAGPFVGVKFIPTGGVNSQNIGEFAAAPFIHTVGGSWVCTRADISARNFDKITALCQEAVAGSLGFEIAHVGINTKSTDVATCVAQEYYAVS